MSAATFARGSAASASLATRGKQTRARDSFKGDWRDAADDKWQSFKMAKVAGTESDLYRIAKVAGVVGMTDGGPSGGSWMCGLRLDCQRQRKMRRPEVTAWHRRRRRQRAR